MRSVSSLVMAATLARSSGRARHRAGRLVKLGVERVDRVAVPVEHVLDRLANGPASVLWLCVELLVGETEQRGDELGARRVIVGEQRRQISATPALQEVKLVANAPHLPGVLLLVEDVVHQQIARGPAPSAAVAAWLLEILLGQVVEDVERLVERILKTSDD